jgi:CHAD domain-containing protein
MKATSSARSSRLSHALEDVLSHVARSEKHARRSLNTESVHDLRVALRRCRSLAEGFAEIDPRPVWRDLRKACGKQQAGLSELRDSQVLVEWVTRLGLSRGPHGQALVRALEKEQRRGKHDARAALKSFSRKHWKSWRHTLPESAGSLTVGSSRLARIAFERASSVCLLERRWRRARSNAAWHRLRIAVKRFRYAVESFLPAQHAVWGPLLKRLQDLLGEGHDLDVLRARILEFAQKQKLPATTRQLWLCKIAQAREQRTRRYLKASALPAKVRKAAATRANVGGPKSHAPRTPARTETYIYDTWRTELAKLAKVNPADAARSTTLTAIRG